MADKLSCGMLQGLCMNERTFNATVDPKKAHAIEKLRRI